jgi:hypothetical protein
VSYVLSTRHRVVSIEFPAVSVRRRTAAIVAAVGLVLSACGSSSDDATVAETAAPTSPSTSTADGAVDAPPDVEAVMVPTADGSELDFNSLRGQDVMLWFWAPW